MILEAVSVGPMEVNCYILASGPGSKAIIIDPGAETRKIRKVLDKYNLKPAFIINTHGHYDHIGSDDEFAVDVYVHAKEIALLKDPVQNFSAIFALPFQVNAEIKPVEDSQVIKLDDLELKVLHIPGHSPGGIALVLLKPQNKIVFTGDTLFCASVGRTDFPGGDGELLLEGIKEKLLSLSEETIIYPGHGAASTIGEEKRNNPFF